MKKEEIIELLGNKLTEVIKISPFDCISITQEQTQEIIQSLTEPTQEGVVSAEEVKNKLDDLVDGYDTQKVEYTDGDEEFLYPKGSVIAFAEDVVDLCFQAMHTYASQTMEELQGKFSIEQQPDGTYKLYVDRDGLHHGLWICSLSDFDKNKESTIRTILNCLNQTRGEEMKKHAVGFLKYYNGDIPIDEHFERAYQEYLNRK